MGLLNIFKHKCTSFESKVAKWIDSVLQQEIPADVAAFCFNLYDDGDGNWSMELVGTQSFDVDDSDWPCDEATDFGTREDPFRWNRNAEWNRILEETAGALQAYLDNGKYATAFKKKQGVGVGFVDGDVEVIWCEAAHSGTNHEK